MVDVSGELLVLCAAALLLTGGVRLAAFTPEALANEDLRAFMSKVQVEEDPEIAARYPALRQARLIVTLAGGEVLEHFQPTRKGDPDDALTDAELFEKYDELAGAVLSAETARQLRDSIMTSDSLPCAVEIERPRRLAS